MSYPCPDTETSSGKRGDLVVAGVRPNVSYVKKGLGIPSRLVSQETDLNIKTSSPPAIVQGKVHTSSIDV